MIGWLILAAYLAGLFAAWIAAFRIFVTDPIMGLDLSDSKHDALATIFLSGFISLLIGVMWPLAGAIILVWKYGVKPVLKKGERDDE